MRARGHLHLVTPEFLALEAFARRYAPLVVRHVPGMLVLLDGRPVNRWTWEEPAPPLPRLGLRDPLPLRYVPRVAVALSAFPLGASDGVLWAYTHDARIYELLLTKIREQVRPEDWERACRDWRASRRPEVS